MMTLVSSQLMGGGFSKYAHWLSLGSAALLLVLGIVATATISLSDSAAGLASIIVSVFVVIIECAKYVPKVRGCLEFFLEKLIFRGGAYIVLSLPSLTKGITAAGGALLLISGLLYIFCWWKGEKGIENESERVADNDFGVGIEMM